MDQLIPLNLPWFARAPRPTVWVEVDFGSGVDFPPYPEWASQEESSSESSEDFVAPPAWICLLDRTESAQDPTFIHCVRRFLVERVLEYKKSQSQSSEKQYSFTIADMEYGIPLMIDKLAKEYEVINREALEIIAAKPGMWIEEVLNEIRTYAALPFCQVSGESDKPEMFIDFSRMDYRKSLDQLTQSWVDLVSRYPDGCTLKLGVFLPTAQALEHFDQFCFRMSKNPAIKIELKAHFGEYGLGSLYSLEDVNLTRLELAGAILATHDVEKIVDLVHLTELDMRGIHDLVDMDILMMVSRLEQLTTLTVSSSMLSDSAKHRLNQLPDFKLICV